MLSIPFLPSLLGVAVLLAVSAGGVSAQTGLKIGYFNSAAIYAEAPGAREAAIREKEGAYRQRIAQMENQAGRRQQELVEPIMRQIKDVIEALRQEGNYSVIFEVGPGSNIIAADPALDLTNEVIGRLRR